MAWFGPEDATDIMPGTSRIVDGLRVGGSAEACDSSGLLPAGDYQASVILEFTSIGPDDLPTTTITASNTVDVTLGDPTDAPSQGPTMLSCGEPTAEITSSTVAGGDKVTLTLDGTKTRIPAGQVTRGAVTAQIVHARARSTGAHVGAGTYEVWATATLTGTDGEETSATGKVSAVTVDPARVTD